MIAPNVGSSNGGGLAVRGRSIAALGDVNDRNCFGGAPWQFLQESRRQGFAQEGWSVDVRRLRGRRVAWNAAQLLRGRKPGGFQFSKSGRAAALAQIPKALLRTEVISFHQHFPPYGPILRGGGEVNYYVDAPTRRFSRRTVSTGRWIVGQFGRPSPTSATLLPERAA
jgi:hypothetical protein